MEFPFITRLFRTGYLFDKDDKVLKEEKLLSATDKCSNLCAFGNFLNEEKEFLDRLSLVQLGSVILLMSDRVLSNSCKCLHLTSLLRHRWRCVLW